MFDVALIVKVLFHPGRQLVAQPFILTSELLAVELQEKAKSFTYVPELVTVMVAVPLAGHVGVIVELLFQMLGVTVYVPAGTLME